MSRLCNYEQNGGCGHKIGLYYDDQVVDLNRALDDIGYTGTVGSVIDVLEGTLELKKAVEYAYCKSYEKADYVYSVCDITILPPVEKPGKFICLAGNYMEHLEESYGKGKVTAPKDIHVFVKSSSSLIGPYDDIIAAESVVMLDYELELGIVIGKRGRYIPENKAAEHIGGYFVANDVSDRAYMPEIPGGRIHWYAMKAQDNFAPFGPCIFLNDMETEKRISDFKMQIYVNGKLCQSVDPINMIFKPEQIISRLSKWVTLEPGDLIITGTPAGNAWSRKSFLKEGDVVEARMDHVGAIKNRIVFEQEIYRC